MRAGTFNSGRRLATRGLSQINAIFVTVVFSLLRMRVENIEIVAFVICDLMLAWYLYWRHSQFVVQRVIVFSVHVRRIGASDELPIWFFVVFKVPRRRHRHFHVLRCVDSLFFFDNFAFQKHLLLQHLLCEVFCGEIYMHRWRLQPVDVGI